MAGQKLHARQAVRRHIQDGLGNALFILPAGDAVHALLRVIGALDVILRCQHAGAPRFLAADDQAIAVDGAVIAIGGGQLQKQRVAGQVFLRPGDMRRARLIAIEQGNELAVLAAIGKHGVHAHVARQAIQQVFGGLALGGDIIEGIIQLPVVLAFQVIGGHHCEHTGGGAQQAQRGIERALAQLAMQFLFHASLHRRASSVRTEKNRHRKMAATKYSALAKLSCPSLKGAQR